MVGASSASSGLARAPFGMRAARRAGGGRRGGARPLTLSAKDGSGGSAEGEGKKKDRENELFELQLEGEVEIGRLVKRQPGKDVVKFELQDIRNPFGLGQKVRQSLSDVVDRMSGLVTVFQSPRATDDELDFLRSDFAITSQKLSEEWPEAGYTTVLVAGATGRVGRVLVRKLLLRGYTVKALVRELDEDGSNGLPPSVEQVVGEVGDLASLRQAVKGIDKIICCIGARSRLSSELNRVDNLGVANLVRVFLDSSHVQAQKRLGHSVKSKVTLAKFGKKGEGIEAWSTRTTGTDTVGDSYFASVARSSKPGEIAYGGDFGVGKESNGYYGADDYYGNYDEYKDEEDEWAAAPVDPFAKLAASSRGSSVASCSLDPAVDAEGKGTGNAVFSGFVYNKTGSAEVSLDLTSSAATARIKSLRGGSLANSEGFVLRCCGDGKAYSFCVQTKTGKEYTYQLTSKQGYVTVRLPFNKFRSSEPGDDIPLDPGQVQSFSIRFDVAKERQRREAVARQKRAVAEPVLSGAQMGLSDKRSQAAANIESLLAQVGTGGKAMNEAAEGAFRLELDYLKALPRAGEPDFLLVSCGGRGAGADGEKVLTYKRMGENQLKNSGLAYSIIRPGPLRDEPGNVRALVFDQGNRITEGISCADVADVCLRSLHDPAACNKSFDVCYEYAGGTSVDETEFEAVVTVPGKRSRYLTPALAPLVRNT